MFRILHSIRSVNPAGGGPIEGLKQIATVNERHGNMVEIVSLDSPHDPWVAQCPVKCHALGPGWLNYGYSPRLVPWLREQRRNYELDVFQPTKLPNPTAKYDQSAAPNATVSAEAKIQSGACIAECSR